MRRWHDLLCSFLRREAKNGVWWPLSLGLSTSCQPWEGEPCCRVKFVFFKRSSIGPLWVNMNNWF